MFWWVSFSPSASVDDAKQNKNQSESEKIRPDTTNVQRTTGRQNDTIVSCKYDSRRCVSLAALVSQPPCEGYNQSEQ